MVIYVGDAGDVVKRILTNHSSGNVEGSALRRHIAKAKGFRISSTKRSSGSTKVRIDSDNPRRDEQTVSTYIRAGSWRIVLCSTYDEAHDFQWFAIEQLTPVCNHTREAWDARKSARYQQLLKHLTTSCPMTYTEVRALRVSGPGVYVLEHQSRPDA